MRRSVNKKEIIVGARGSLLSVCQTEGVIASLRRKFPGRQFAFHKIVTLGDKGKEWQRTDQGIFVKEIEDALRSGAIDMAVHSAKDMPSSLGSGFTLAAVTKRENPHDVLLTREGTPLNKLMEGALIGTSSLRRQAQILSIRPDVRIAELRGNLDTRIKKLNDCFYDAIILAYAGISRMKYRGLRAKVLPVSDMLHAVGQGALGIEVRRQDAAMIKLAKSIDDAPTHACIAAERAFLKESRAGCRMPVAAYAQIRGGRIVMEGLIISLDGKRVVRKNDSAPVKDAVLLGASLARKVLSAGGKQILEEIRHG